jgi:hypothetical protein
VDGKVVVSFYQLNGKLNLLGDPSGIIRMTNDAGVEMRAESISLSADRQQLEIETVDGVCPKRMTYAYQNFCQLQIFDDHHFPISPCILKFKINEN